MEVLITITSVFSALIIMMTVYNMMKVLLIAYKRKEISGRKFIIFGAIAIVTGFIVASVLPYGYTIFVEYIY
ncbi:hypothetical protein [Bacillus sp. T33-2]|uniref:hypothetical protein n=1 Tax=Bacillus sp. T33-2 TaxID=2054168 RepID=UPI000C795661|nr:hypothetical protein [Bacillus sp. T33-2]PLR92007.1 hypothetical protein CVD19_20870 [Bacillus sp. T33-2]